MTGSNYRHHEQRSHRYRQRRKISLPTSPIINHVFVFMRNLYSTGIIKFTLLARGALLGCGGFKPPVTHRPVVLINYVIICSSFIQRVRTTLVRLCYDLQASPIRCDLFRKLVSAESIVDVL